jgi:hypothetical protein
MVGLHFPATLAIGCGHVTMFCPMVFVPLLGRKRTTSSPLPGCGRQASQGIMGPQEGESWNPPKRTIIALAN